MADPKHFILTDPVNSGKSSRLYQYVLDNIRDKQRVSGWLCLPVFDGQARKGYDLTLLIQSQMQSPIPFIRPTPFAGAVKWRRFYFDQTVFETISNLDFGNPDLFVLDEVGPLELEDKLGFWPFLENVYQTHNHTITIVRENCLDLFRNTFATHHFDAIIYSIYS
ncbi:MAG: hypothetical protein ACD_62C00209G0013 [uncultured bacterium]|nr:MAG: hypothetical protein ACD_62C00209G0013 [uncultured bacterium]